MLEELYDKLCCEPQKSINNIVKAKTGFFNENDFLYIFNNYKFKIDKEAFLYLANEVVNRVSEIQAEPKSYEYFNRVIDVVSSSINDYFGNFTVSENERLQFYELNGKPSPLDEDEKICSMSDLRGQGIAMCAEKASVANNLLVFLKEAGLFNYETSYLNGLLEINDVKLGHAFLSIEKPSGSKLIYDITLPEKVNCMGQEIYCHAIYGLTAQEYESFLNGEPFDNNKFIFSNQMEMLEQRVYSGFIKEKEK